MFFVALSAFVAPGSTVYAPGSTTSVYALTQLQDMLKIDPATGQNTTVGEFALHDDATPLERARLGAAGQWAETWDGGATWHFEGDKSALPAALVAAEAAAKAAVEAQDLVAFGTIAPGSNDAAAYSWAHVDSGGEFDADDFELCAEATAKVPTDAGGGRRRG